MDAIEISKVLSDWASALDTNDGSKTRRTSLSDLVKKYSLDADSEENIASAVKRFVRPWSLEDFTARLLTFQKSTDWFAKPQRISALQCARHGWCNGGINQIYCLTCGAKLTHSKADDDGQRLGEALCSGHYSYCGWINNFCSEEFLSFPLKSSESLRIDLLQRIRVILLATAEWARYTCENNIDETLIASSRLQVQLGSVMKDSAPEVSQWLFGEQLVADGADAGASASAILETSLSDISNPSCRSYLAMAVEVIDRLLIFSGDFDTSSASVSVSDTTAAKNGIEGSTSSILQALLLPTVDASSSVDLMHARQLIRICVLMAICGWTAISSPNSLTMPNTVENIATSLTASSTVITIPIAVSAITTTKSFKCELCGRCLPFKYLLSSPVDPLYQHRSFCLWVNSSIGTSEGNNCQKNENKVQAGWLQCVNSFINPNQPSITPLAPYSSQRKNFTSEDSRRKSLDNIDNKKVETCGDAEQTYKKIKLALDRATFRHANDKGRQSI